MPVYRRLYQKGGTYFFTLVTWERQPLFREDEAVSLLMECFEKTTRAHPFSIDALVVLPDHLHTIWSLPDGDSDFSTRWNLIKGSFSRRFKGESGQAAIPSRLRKRERAVWQRRFWEHLVRDQEDYNTLCDYIHYNPVKHGLAASPGEWKHSTFARFVEMGLYPMDRGLPDAAGLVAIEPE